MEHPELSKNWHKDSNYLTVLNVRDEEHLVEISGKLSDRGIQHVSFREPDIDNQLTSIAVLSNDVLHKVTSSLPLALKKIGSGLTKHCV
jgi:hypothetical protein